MAMFSNCFLNILDEYLDELGLGDEIQFVEVISYYKQFRDLFTYVWMPRYILAPLDAIAI